METFETTLTGSDTLIDGIVSPIGDKKKPDAFEFISLDDSLHLTIARDENGAWIRIAGTEPYLSGWVDELAEKISTEK